MPEFEPPTQTAPQMEAASALPDVREILEIKLDPATLKYPDVTFEAQVVSEDVSKDVRFRFYIDYGVENDNGLPFRDDTFAGRLEPGTLADGPRKFSKAFRPPTTLEKTCHTLTLIASHDFHDETSCPCRLADSSELTWRFVLCPDAMPCLPTLLPQCAPQTQEPLVSCPETSGVPVSGGGCQ